jgi:putative methyltransferase (TIGR04325 family)
MPPLGGTLGALGALGAIGALRAWIRYRRRRLNGFTGVFPTFQAAARSAPPGAAIGYDNVHAGEMYRELLATPRHSDYPALFWLNKALRSSRTILEIGGHVGVAYYAFERHLEASPERWTILDTPAVAQAGVSLARERGRTNLSFVSSFDEMRHPFDVLFASGSLQYLDGPPLGQHVGRLETRPRHILINNTPVTDREGFFTLQDIGISFCPYRIHSRSELIDPLLADGYELVDSWQKERRLEVPGHPERTLEHYSGFYLARAD